ncbi:hypothetical protein MARPO_0035s0039 [Marchantia polymorpha]|uniref:Uncharacterized protein n=1 Tax=Marchantia polymorpha TaxID=3197 RepID=A0A2R6X568_MARPO|nr:hypothetical protein MARPO_0035s0039 [Marchantia polymorpha]|eukprot:PTQ41244.1 hypothetical protein MARPO_0035s0039 [Marchantia polymorpha]
MGRSKRDERFGFREPKERGVEAQRNRRGLHGQAQGEEANKILRSAKIPFRMLHVKTTPPRQPGPRAPPGLEQVHARVTKPPNPPPSCLCPDEEDPVPN